MAFSRDALMTERGLREEGSESAVSVNRYAEEHFQH